MDEWGQGRPSAAAVGRRYLPLAAVLLALLLVVALAPSTPIRRDTEGALGAGDRRSVSAGEDAPLTGPEGDAPAAEGSAMATHAGSGPAARTREGPRSRSSAAPGAATASAPAGSTAHCVAGRQFDPAIDVYAPPCRPRSDHKNPGATSQGVTGEEILLVDYVVEPGAGPSTFLRAQDMAATPEQQARFTEAAEKFINDHYELYGRKVRIEQWHNTTCSVQPPDESCFRPDAAQLVANKKPFAVVNSFVAPMSFFFDELSQRKTVNVGGWQFREAFSAARRPYHWDPNLSGTRMAQIFAEWYCRQLHGRPVQYAGQPRPPQRSFNGQPRVLGVVALNDAENKAVVTSVLEPALAQCGAEVAHTFFVEPNIQRAAEQNRAAIETMRRNPTATTVLCICGPAMALLHAQMQEENYYPEHLNPGNSLTDLDSVAQFFTGPLGCPSRRDCQAENMFGLAEFGPQEPRNQGVGSRVWRAAGNRGSPPYPRVDLDWTYWNMLASLIQQAGPHLTPAALERAAAELPAVGGGTSGHPLRWFGSDSHSWIRDMRAVYWSTTKPSPYNRTTGTWVQVGGSRFDLGATPAGPLVLPPKPR